ncbi:G-protein gamma-like domain-containing protein [Scleroderma citrinum]
MGPWGGRQSMSEIRYRHLLEHNQRLQEDLTRYRIRISEASAGLIRYCKITGDPLVPSVWGPVQKTEDPYALQASRGFNCCSIQ